MYTVYGIPYIKIIRMDEFGMRGIIYGFQPKIVFRHFDFNFVVITVLFLVLLKNGNRKQMEHL